MEFYFINSQTKFQPNQFNILEPINSQKVSDFKNAVCLTPGLCLTKPAIALVMVAVFTTNF
jgi:hypothetical protein